MTHIVPAHESSASMSDGKQPITQMVREANRAMKKTLSSLRHCALKLATDNDAFIFNSSKGLTPETGMRIEEKIANQEVEIRSLSQQLADARQKEERIKQERFQIVVGAPIAFLILIFIGTVAVFAEATAIAVFTIILTVGGMLLIWLWYQSMRSRLDAATRTNASYNSCLEQAKSSLDELTAAKLRFSETEFQLRMNVAAFIDLVDQYEANGLKRISFSPARSIERKDSDDLVRADTEKEKVLGPNVDTELLPVSLRFLSSSSGPKQSTGSPDV